MIRLALLLIAALYTCPAQAGSEVAAMPEARSLVSFDHDAPSIWRTVNDGVMGGVSQSAMQTTEENSGLFTGILSLANNGGFASVRATPAETDLAAWSGLELRVRGDGRTYQVRLRTNGRFDGVAYRALLPTKAGEWLTVQLPFTAFEPTFRGRILRDVPPLDTGNIVQLTLMIADKTQGPFRLEVGRVSAWLDERNQP